MKSSLFVQPAFVESQFGSQEAGSGGPADGVVDQAEEIQEAAPTP
jgi:hypothetical protein